MAYNVTELPAYVEQHASDLLAKSVFDASSVKYLTIQTGVKGDTTLNLVDVDVTFQDGDACGFDASGDDKFTQRTLSPYHLKVNKEWCDKDMLGKYAQYQVVTAATGKKLPFEEDLMNGVTSGIAEGIESYIWGGDDHAGGLVNGIHEAPSANHVTATSDIWADTKAAYLKLPANVLGKSDLMGYMAPSDFEKLVLQLTDLNLYHYNPTDEAGVITMPGTNVKIARIAGLTGSNVKLAFARKSNMFYGVDTESDSTDFDLWYSKDNRTFRLAVEFNVASQVAFPEEITAVIDAA